MLKTIALTFGALALSASAAFAESDTFHYYSPAEAKALDAPGDLSIKQVTKFDNFAEMAVSRSRSGAVEIHDHYSDYIIFLEGKATVVIGGTVSGKTQIGPGEWHGISSTGGKSYAVEPGSLMIVPANTPHWFQLPEGGYVRYIAVKRRND